MFNEKIFIYFWFWFLLVGVLSVLSLLYWIFATLLPGQRRNFISRYLRCTNAISSIFPEYKEARMVDDFIRRYLRPDGVFLLRLIQVKNLITFTLKKELLIQSIYV